MLCECVAAARGDNNPFWDKPLLGLIRVSAFIWCDSLKSLNSDAHQKLCALLSEARSQVPMVQAELSERLGRPQSFVSKYERGERRLDVVEFLEVCRGLDADPHAIIQQVELAMPKKGRRSQK